MSTWTQVGGSRWAHKGAIMEYLDLRDGGRFEVRPANARYALQVPSQRFTDRREAMRWTEDTVQRQIASGPRCPRTELQRARQALRGAR
jgi:hypothetical protein